MSQALATIEEAVREKVRGAIIESIPEELWIKMVRALVLDFENKELPKLVNAELTERYRIKIREVFDSPEWQDRWNGADRVMSEKLQELLVEAAPLILANMMGGVAQDMINNLKYALQNRQF